MKKHNWIMHINAFRTWLICSDCKHISCYAADNEKDRAEQFNRTDCDEKIAENAARRLLGKPKPPENVRITRL